MRYGRFGGIVGEVGTCGSLRVVAGRAEEDFSWFLLLGFDRNPHLAASHSRLEAFLIRVSCTCGGKGQIWPYVARRADGGGFRQRAGSGENLCVKCSRRRADLSPVPTMVRYVSLFTHTPLVKTNKIGARALYAL